VFVDACFYDSFMLASMTHLWATTRGISLPVTNSLHIPCMNFRYNVMSVDTGAVPKALFSSLGRTNYVTTTIGSSFYNNHALLLWSETSCCCTGSYIYQPISVECTNAKHWMSCLAYRFHVLSRPISALTFWATFYCAGKWSGVRECSAA
jgi:hypothetical protein